MNSNNGYGYRDGQKSGFDSGMNLGRQGPYDATKGSPVDNGRSQFDWRPIDGAPGAYTNGNDAWVYGPQNEGIDMSRMFPNQYPGMDRQNQYPARSNLSQALMGGYGF